MQSSSMSIPSLQIKAPGGQPPIPKFTTVANPLPTPSFMKKAEPPSPNASNTPKMPNMPNMSNTSNTSNTSNMSNSSNSSNTPTMSSMSMSFNTSLAKSAPSPPPSLKLKKSSSDESMGSVASNGSGDATASKKDEKKASRKASFLSSFRKSDDLDAKSANDSPHSESPSITTRPKEVASRPPRPSSSSRKQSSGTKGEYDSNSEDEAVANFDDSDIEEIMESSLASKTPQSSLSSSGSFSSTTRSNSTAADAKPKESTKRTAETLQSIVQARRTRFDEAQKLFSATTFPENFELSNIYEFVARPPLVSQIVSCVIVRNQNEFSCLLDTADQVIILSAYRTNTVSGTSYFIRTNMKHDFCDGTQMVLKSNLMRTKFTIHSSSKLDDMIAQIEFSMSQPRQMLVTFYHTPIPLNRPGAPDPALMNSCWKLKSNPPIYDARQKAYGLRFGPRVRIASCKNFQLVKNEKKTEEVFMEFGKYSEDSFAMDYKSPLNGIQAFFISLSVFDALSV